MDIMIDEFNFEDLAKRLITQAMTTDEQIRDGKLLFFLTNEN